MESKTIGESGDRDMALSIQNRNDKPGRSLYFSSTGRAVSLGGDHRGMARKLQAGAMPVIPQFISIFQQIRLARPDMPARAILGRLGGKRHNMGFFLFLDVILIKAPLLLWLVFP